jgi:putative hydrolase of the HAD superfamily
VKRFVFDFAAVLFDWEPARLVKQVIPAHAPDDDTAARLARSIFQQYRGDWADFDRGTVSVAALAQRIAARTGLPEAAVLAVVDAIPDALTPIAPTVDLVERLRRPGRPMFFLSNMPSPYADLLERRHAFVRAFDDGVFSGRIGLAKPDLAIFDAAARRFGTAPEDLVFLDDQPVNVDAARQAGWNALEFTDAAAAERAIRAAGWWPD